MLHANWTVAILEAVLVFLILYKIFSARRGKSLYIRRIPGLSAIDEAVGRAAEMGRPIMFSPGLAQLSLPTLQALSILKHVTNISAKYRTRIVVPTADSVVYTIAEEISKDAYSSQGVPEQFNAEDVRFVSDDQFAYASGCVGILNREKVASNLMFGTFFAESLILAETGHQVGAVQVAGTPSITQIPFFITACDYTIIGDEFYAASAYLSREPTLLGSLVGQDWAKATLVSIMLLGVITASLLTPLLRGKDVSDPARLAALLKGDEGAVSMHIRKQLSPSTRSLLAEYQAGARPSDNLERALTEDLNRLLRKGDLYAPERFRQVKLRDETLVLAGLKLHGAERVKFNRMLLEDSYPREIAERHSWLEWFEPD